ncbi:MAG: hypothetical protein HC897_03805 [Thermoanaerobaculia bacterium]|nr:hypothetical protein [Thermoanaerobaculia bacterium]
MDRRAQLVDDLDTLDDPRNAQFADQLAHGPRIEHFEQIAAQPRDGARRVDSRQVGGAPIASARMPRRKNVRRA